MANLQTRQALMHAILKRRGNEQLQKEKKSMKGYIPSYLEGDEKCVVCEDKATGYHYKCITCEGCKGFFRRTVQKSLEGTYQCKHEMKCEINKVTRNQCQLCRYNKCVTVGMATDLVLDEEKRVAKRRLIEQNREVRRHKQLSQMMAQCGWRIERPTDDERRIIHDVTQAYFNANDVQNRTMDITHEGMPVSERFSIALTSAITNVVDFAKKIPLFVHQISSEDQVKILKGCCMEVITLRCVTSYREKTKSVTLFPSVDVTKDQLRHTRLEPFGDSLFLLAEHMETLDLTPVEIAMLQAIVILSGDRPELTDVTRIDEAQETIIQAFEHHINEIWPHDPQYWPKLLMKLTEVRTVSACLSGTLMSMRMDDPEELAHFFRQRHLADTNISNNEDIGIRGMVSTSTSHTKSPTSSSLLSCHNSLPSPHYLTSGIHGDINRYPNHTNGYKHHKTTSPGENGYFLTQQNHAHTTSSKTGGASRYTAWKKDLINDMLAHTRRVMGTNTSKASNDEQCAASTSKLKPNGLMTEQHVMNQYNIPNGTSRSIGSPSIAGKTPDLNCYETIRNSHDKVFERVVKSRNSTNSVPNHNIHLSAMNQYLFNSQNSHVRKDNVDVNSHEKAYSSQPNGISFPPNYNHQHIYTGGNPHFNMYNHGPQLYPHLTAKHNPQTQHLPHIYAQNGEKPRVSLPHNYQQRANGEIVMMPNYVDMRMPTATNGLTKPDASLTAGILRMGLPMLLPYVTGVNRGQVPKPMPSLVSCTTGSQASKHRSSHAGKSSDSEYAKYTIGAGVIDVTERHATKHVTSSPKQHEVSKPKISVDNYKSEEQHSTKVEENNAQALNTKRENGTTKAPADVSTGLRHKNGDKVSSSLTVPPNTSVQTKRQSLSPLASSSKQKCVSPRTAEIYSTNNSEVSGETINFRTISVNVTDQSSPKESQFPKVSEVEKSPKSSSSSKSTRVDMGLSIVTNKTTDILNKESQNEETFIQLLSNNCSNQ